MVGPYKHTDYICQIWNSFCYVTLESLAFLLYKGWAMCIYKKTSIFLLLLCSLRKDQHILTIQSWYDRSTLLTLITQCSFMFLQTACNRHIERGSFNISDSSQSWKAVGKDMNQMDERGLSLAVIDPFAPGMIQDSFGDFPPPPLLLFNTSLKAFKRLSITVWHTWHGADGMRCYQFE